jgi:integrase
MSGLPTAPRLLRFRDAPAYLGMDKNRFNREVRPSVAEIRIGVQGIAFDRLDLDKWADLAHMALFKVNTGTRDQEVVQLRWDWEVKLPEVNKSVFVIPSSIVKNKADRVVILNDVAQSVVESMRGQHDTHVFTYEGHAVTGINSSGWKAARRRATARYLEVIGSPCPPGFRHIRVHDLKHTFGRRLRSVGVSFEDRQDLLGHKSSRITTHYSQAEITNLIEASNRVCQSASRKSPAVVFCVRRVRAKCMKLVVEREGLDQRAHVIEFTGLSCTSIK